MKKTTAIIFILGLLVTINGALAVVTTSGTITTDGAFSVVTFLTNGTFNTTDAIANATILLVGGGGAGVAGGGGGGGLIYNTSFSIGIGNHNITIGKGGVGIITNTFPTNTTTSGQNSSFDNINAVGGGYGGMNGGGHPGGAGGSGGGAGYASSSLIGGTGVSGQGFNGGNNVFTTTPYPSAGGGGAGGAGKNASSVNIAGNGSIGLTLTISGTSVCYAGGGGGSFYEGTGTPGKGFCGGGNGTLAGNGIPGTNGTGGGGGGGYSTANKGGDGGTGIVIIRYQTDFVQNNITFYNQTPQNITSVTLFSSNVLIQYNISNTSSMSNAVLQYKVNHNDACYQYLNGTCELKNNTYYNTTSTANSTNLFNWSVGENVLYHSNSFLSYIYFNKTKNTTTLSSNDVFDLTFINFSLNDNLNYLEVMSLSSGISNVYYCNSSYNTSNPAGSSDCSQIYSATMTFNHSHNQYSNHTLFTFSQNNTGYIGSVKATSTSHFLLKPNSGQTITLFYIENRTGRTNNFRISNNNGGAYSEFTSGTPDAHLHQFSTTDQVIYKGCINKSDTFECTSETTTAITESIFKPAGVQITQPNNSVYQQFINISYTIVQHPNFPLVNNTNVNISLYNSTGLVAFIVKNNLSNNYTFNSYIYNLSINPTYYFLFTTEDTYNQTTTTQSEYFNFSSNAYINFSVKNVSLFINNYTIVLKNNQTGEIQTIIVNSNVTNSSQFHIVKNFNYSVNVTSPGFAFAYLNYTTNNTYNNYTIFMIPTNSISIYFYDEITKSALTTNVSFLIHSDNYEFNSSTNTGFLFASNLLAGDYVMRYRSDPYYIERAYYVTISNGSTQTFSLYLINNTMSQIVTTSLKDTYGNIISGADIKLLRYYPQTNTYEIVEIVRTDNNGKGYFKIQVASNENNGEFFKFIISIDDVIYLDTTPSKIYDTILNFIIATTESTLTEYNENLGLVYDVSFNNATNNFRLTFSNGLGTFIGACLKVYKINNIETTLYNQSCVNSSAATILVGIENKTGYSYMGKAYAYYGTYELFLGAVTQAFSNVKEVMGKNGLFLALIMIILFALIGIYNLYISAVLMVVGLIMMSLFGLISIAWTFIMGIICVAFFIVLVKKNG